MDRVFYESDDAAEKLRLPRVQDDPTYDANGSELQDLRAFYKVLARVNHRQREPFLGLTPRMVARGGD